MAVSQLEKAADKKRDSAAKGDKNKAASNSKVEKEKLQKVSTAEKDGKKSQKKKTQTSAAKGDASKPSTSKFEVRFIFNSMESWLSISDDFPQLSLRRVIYWKSSS